MSVGLTNVFVSRRDGVWVIAHRDKNLPHSKSSVALYWDGAEWNMSSSCAKVYTSYDKAHEDSTKICFGEKIDE